MRRVCSLLLCFALLQLLAIATFAFAFWQLCKFDNSLQLLQLLPLLLIFISKSREGCPGGFICAWFAVVCFVLNFCSFLQLLPRVHGGMSETNRDLRKIVGSQKTYKSKSLKVRGNSYEFKNTTRCWWR